MQAEPNDPNTSVDDITSKRVTHAPDVLSQVLTWVRLRGEAVFPRAIPAGQSMSSRGGAGCFFFISEGECRIDTDDGSTTRAVAGDLVLLPTGAAHRLTAVTALNCVEGAYRYDGDGLPPVLAALPSCVHISNAGRVPDWLGALTHFLLEESRQIEPGSSLMVSRLVDVLVIRALRAWATEGDGRFGRLAGLTDERVGRALRAMHDAPLRRWTVAELAHISAMSRSGFAERFVTKVGEAPLRYLARWRLHMAAEMLRSGMRIGEVAGRIGYSSDAAFSRAFKACFGERPGERRAS
ncbi:AraC family transcriptional regulator [Luteibacter aegosomatissinici]|uniref:AraC family transcriptional regulator n=1 Tax=Luteibacter aegosomatissinici TaxID=2911539 RepID=UPI001FF9AEE9|nr:AraC family transcriptional regulator [Luteibacter aegosomatissinici]UPG92744.1 AraC family transcriptional regulator [Luteibacter aegosomatissinici]